MTNKVNMAPKELSEPEIDDLAAAPADDQSAWSKPVHALRTKRGISFNSCRSGRAKMVSGLEDSISADLLKRKNEASPVN